MPDKTVWEVADAYRKAQEAHDTQVSNDLARNMYEVQQSLRDHYEPIMAAIEDAQNTGQPLTPAQVAQMERFHTLDRQATLLLARFGQYADHTIPPAVSRAIADAQEAAQAMTSAAYIDTEPVKGAAAAVMAGWNQLDDRTVEALSARTAENSPFQQLAGLNASTIDAMKAVLLTGAALGHNSAKMGKAISQQLAVPLARAMTIARTEAHTAAREATRLTYEANSDIVGGWIWRCARTSRTCAVCWAMDGQAFDTSVKHFTHVNCRCTMVPKTHSWAELGFHGIPEPKQPPSGEDAFERLSDEDKKRVLGPGKYRLYRDKKLTLDELVGEGTDPRYGGYRYERSLRDIDKPQHRVLPNTPPHPPPPPPPQPKVAKTVTPKVEMPRAVRSKYSWYANPNASADDEYQRFLRETGRTDVTRSRFGIEIYGKQRQFVEGALEAGNPRSKGPKRDTALEAEAEKARQRVLGLRGSSTLMLRDAVSVDEADEAIVNANLDPRLPHHDGRYETGIDYFSRFVSRKAYNVRPNQRVNVTYIASARAYQSAGNVYMADYAGSTTMVHELGHTFEYQNYSAMEASRAFVARRTAGETQVRLKDITGSEYDPSEVTYADTFWHPYIGKEYGPEGTEVMSMGLQQFYEDPYMLAESDPDMFIHVYMNARNPKAALAYQYYLIRQEMGL
jgi:SPP1 gp7 family putative phage head morphogenesis protein